jgi:hypothetical protein
MPIPWSLVTGEQKGLASVVIDTDGDLIPDTQIPGTSNFAAGQLPDSFMNKTTYCSCCPTGYTCHDYNGEQHCTDVTMCPDMANCC